MRPSTVTASPGHPGAWRFEEFELDVRAGELRRGGAPVKLQPQPFTVLALLVERAGDLVLRDELKRALWGEETYVDFERGLNFCVNQVRAALGDSAEAPRFVQTVPRRGYRFIARVRPGSDRGRTGVGPGSDPGPSKSTERLKVDWQILLAGTAFLATLVIGATLLARQTNAPAPRPARTMVAVLPLEDLTGDSPPLWFADGLTDEIISQLGRVSPRQLGVIARTSAMTYRGSNKTVSEVGRELGVSHVLEGSVRREDTRIRVSVQLVSAADQSTVWSETYDRTAHGALTIQTDVATQVARALALELIPGASDLSASATTQLPEARDAYLRGRYLLTRGRPEDVNASLEQFTRAIDVDPRFAAAYAGRAGAYHLLAMSGRMAPTDAYARASGDAASASHLAPDQGASHAARGLVQLWSEWNPEAAAASFRLALSLNPSDAAAHHDLAWALVALQRFDEAVVHITRARELDPVSPRANNDVGWLFLHIRQPSEAIRACRHTLAIEPYSIEAQQCLERAHLQRGELTEALAAARRAASTRGQPTLLAALEKELPPTVAIERLWRARLDSLRSVTGERTISPYTIAMHHIVLDREDDALRELERGFEIRSSAMVLLPTDPLFDRLRSNARFTSLVERIRSRAAETRSDRRRNPD